MATASVPDDESRDLECPVCQEQFRTPKMLPCGHTLCLDPCLRQLCKGIDHVRCPECRTDHQLPAGGVDGFPTNISLARMMKTDATRKKPTKSSCPICGSDELLVKCFHCSILVCERCRLHHTEELKVDVLQELERSSLSDEKIAAELNQLRDSAMTELESKVESYLNQVSSVEDILIKAVRARTGELTNKIKSYQVDEELKTSSRVSSVSEALHEMSKLCARSISDMTSTDYTVTQSDLLTKRDTLHKLQQELNLLKGCVSEIKVIQFKMDPSDLLLPISALGTFEECTLPAEDTKLPQYDSANEDLKTSGIRSLLRRDCMEPKKCIGRSGEMARQFKNLSCLAVCPRTGNIVVGQSGRPGKLHIFDRGCKHIVSADEDVNMESLYKLRDIAVSELGMIIIIEQCTDNAYCHVFTDRAEPIKLFEIKQMFAVDIDKDEHIHICHGCEGVTVYDFDGTTITKYNVNVDEPFDARHIAIAKDGTIYLTDVSTEVKQHHYYVLNSRKELVRWGNFIHIPKQIKSKIVHTFFPDKMKLVEDKYFLIADTETERVYIFDLDWKQLKAIDVTGHSRGQPYKPTEAGITKDGDLVVISGNGLLQFF